MVKNLTAVFKRTRPGLPTRHQFELHEIQLGGGGVCVYVDIRIYEWAMWGMDVKKPVTISGYGRMG